MFEHPCVYSEIISGSRSPVHGNVHPRPYSFGIRMHLFSLTFATFLHARLGSYSERQEPRRLRKHESNAGNHLRGTNARSAVSRNPKMLQPKSGLNK